MLSVASLLNPAPSGPSMYRGFPPSPASSSPTSPYADESSFFERPMMPKQKLAKDAPVWQKGKPKGVVNFAPFERLDEISLREVRKYGVLPLGKIQDYCRHIPYNSGKKDFFVKTGRESFEVFQYVFKVQGDETEYTVMWDYNVGLVRMTPFFKCCKYSKTTPAKMLNQNPGLKEITHSITGGSIMAQGYWMPYACAKAVCATFCHHIAGALTPIFGPDFPSICVPPESPDYGRMVISQSIILESTIEANHFRRQYNNTVTSAGNLGPKRERRFFRSPYDDLRHQSRQRIQRTFTPNESPYTTDNDGEISPVTDRSMSDRFMYSPASSSAQLRPSSGWTPANVLPHHYNALGPTCSSWLSAVPGFTSSQPDHARPYQPPLPPPQLWRPKRSAGHIDADYEYDAGESRTATGTNTTANSPIDEKPAEPVLGPDKNAALLLMNLSVRDNVDREKGTKSGVVSETSSPIDQKFPRIKRLRANSM